ncbi:MAG: MMPL family transporter [Thermomicrobiales bacterium]
MVRESIAMLYRWGTFLFSNRKRVLFVSLLGLIVSIAGLATIAPNLSSDGFVDEDAESFQVDEALATEFDRGGDSLVFIFDAEQPISEPAVRAAVEQTLLPLANDPQFAAVLTTWNTGNPGFVSENGFSTLAIAQIDTAADVLPEDVVPGVEERAEQNGLTVSTGGGEVIGEAIGTGVEEGLLRAEIFSIPLTIIVQLLVFGGLIAAGVPLLVGLLAIVGAVAIIFGLSTDSFQSVFAVNIVTMLGLGLGIDYSLFMVARFREELKHRPTNEAIAVSMATVGKTILFSAITVIFALAATQFFPLPAVRSMGQAGMIVVGLALVYGLTFLPALLAVLGPRIDSIAIGLPGRRNRTSSGEGRVWHAIAEGVMRRPVAILVPVLAVLLIAGIPFLRLDITPGGPEVLPTDDPARIATERLNTEFPGGEAEPVPVLITAADGNALSPASISALTAFVTTASSIEHVNRVDSFISTDTSGVWANYTGDPASLSADLQAQVDQYVRTDSVLVEIETSAEGAALEDLVRDLRDVPLTGASVEVGGFGGASVDTVDGIAEGIVPALIFVIIGSYLILLLTFGSVLLPIKAIFMTLLSISASLGALVLVFQDGRLEGLLNFQASGEIISTTPILLFCIMFGLSMDYEVLMLSRIQEEYLRTGDNRSSVARGLEKSAKVVTGAAVIMTIVFGGFMLADIVVLKSMGFGLALAVLIDATIVRALLVPATMRLMGRWNWWAPTWITTLVARLGLSHAEPPMTRSPQAGD